ncbi:MAG: sel1 repeat family protein [Muribaculum sp.]|nr:sel1 repeat family protein [Muribaculum sp.]
MKRTGFYSDELEKGIELLFFQADSEKYDEAVQLLQTACSRKEPDAFYMMMLCSVWGGEELRGKIGRYGDYAREGVRAGSELCVLGAGADYMINEVSSILLHSVQISVNKVKDMAFEGNPMAQYVLGCFYLEDGVGRFIKCARYFTEDHPEQDNQDFLIHLRVNCAYEGLKWVLRAARRGCLPAVEKAYAVYQRESKAHRPMIDRAGEKASAYAEEMAAGLEMRGEFDFTVGQAYEEKEDWEKAREWLQKGVDAGNVDSINGLARLYAEGRTGVEADRAKSVELYRISAGQSSCEGLFRLAECYFHGLLVEKNLREAFELYRRAAEQNMGVAQYYMASYYRYGWDGAAQDYKECLRYAQMAVKNGCNAAKAYVGEAYLYADEMKNGFLKNPQVGIRILKECVEQDNTDLGGRALAQQLLKKAGQ